jgi:endogenous inhibitor of DNA gyrase (YacG/DUF329 family)
MTDLGRWLRGDYRVPEAVDDTPVPEPETNAE